MVNALEPGDEAIVCINGAFSERMAIVASRISGVTIHRVEAPLGRTVDPDDVRRAGKGRKIKMVGVCHGETSTGVVTQLDEFRKVADELGALLIVDTVATLGGVPLDIDRQRVDICFSGSQKAISAPPGMSPITVSPQAEEVLRLRKTPVQSWYFDLTMVMNFWGTERTYHHTPPISLVFALREALRIVFEEGLEAGWSRHRQNQQALIAGIEALGLELFVSNPADRLPTVTSVRIPEGKGGRGVSRRATAGTSSASKSPEASARLRERSGESKSDGIHQPGEKSTFFCFSPRSRRCSSIMVSAFRREAGVGAAVHVYSHAETATVAPRK